MNIEVERRQYRQLNTEETFESADEELVGHTTHQRNWRGIIIALVVIIAVCALIIATIVLISPNADDSTKKKTFTFDDFMSKTYNPRSYDVSWIKGADAYYYRNADGAVFKYNCSNNSSTMVMDNSTFKELDTSHYSISLDEQHALLPYDIHKIYRHSTLAKYKIYNISSRTSESLTGPNGLQFQYVSWSPNGKGLVFVQDNNIYYREDRFQASTTRQITSTGVNHLFYNGVPDWVYEEEVLGEDNAIWFSPGGKYFLYGSFNDSHVGVYDMAYYGSPHQKYVETRHIAYPKAGTTNPTFKLSVYNTVANTTINIDPPAAFQRIDHYFTDVAWQDEEHVVVIWLNRPQNISIVTVCSAENGSCYENFRLESTTGWLDVFSTPLFAPDGQHYFMIIPQKEGDAGSFKHIAMIDASVVIDPHNNNFGVKRFVTTGLYDVVQILSYDEKNDLMYYLAYKAGDPTSRHLYSTITNEVGTGFQQPKCLSCGQPGTCDWVSASFSYIPGGHYVLACLGPAVPTYTLYSPAGKTGVVLEDNQWLKTAIQDLRLPVTKFVQIPLSEKQTMWGKILHPQDTDDDVKYHLLMNVYGGPGSQRVSRTFKLGWEEYLASKHSIVIGYADGRGTGGRGDRWLHANYRKFGTVEVDDTLTAGRYFKSLGYVGENTAIWGWSYGGFLTASVIGQGTDVFTCGISVAPVTDWRYYDSIYTERYMGMPTPGDNEESYSYSNVSRYASGFKKSRFMVVHGTGDDNVHFQNTAQLVRALTEEDVYFRTQFYTDQQHSIDGGNSRRHLYHTLEDFLMQCYGSPTSVDELNRKQPTTKDTDD